MPINVPKHGISYFPVPKVACSALKAFFFEINNGISYLEFKKQTNAPGSVHLLSDYRTTSGRLACYADVIPSFKRVSVVRDPFQRIFSAYKDKILGKSYLTDITKKCLVDLNLEELPSFGSFLANINGYISASAPLKHHVVSAELFLPPKMFAADIVIQLEKKDALANFCKSLTSDVQLRKINASKQQVDRSYFKFDENQFALGIEYLEKEYAFLSQYYTAPSYEQAKEIIK